MPSCLARVSSSFVPRMRNLLCSGLMAAKSGYSDWKRLPSAVRRSRWTDSGLKATVDLSLSIFLRKREVTTVVPVW